MKLRILALAMISLCLFGCSDSVDKAVAVIDRGIEDISSESAQWQTVLQRVSTELPKSVSEVIRQDAQQLATRSIADGGAEFKCSVDFLGKRAITSLQNLRSKITGAKLPHLAPAFCHISPASIDLKASPDSWSKVTLHGYDIRAFVWLGYY